MRSAKTTEAIIPNKQSLVSANNKKTAIGLWIATLGIFIFTSLWTSAQIPDASRQRANKGHVYGKVVDDAGKAVSDASVIILQNKYDSSTRKTREVLLHGMTTKMNGDFSFSELPMFGKLKLQISVLGYQPYEQEFSFNSRMPNQGTVKPNSNVPQKMNSNALNAFDKDLGNITLQPDAIQLQAVEVTASKPLMQIPFPFPAQKCTENLSQVKRLISIRTAFQMKE